MIAEVQAACNRAVIAMESSRPRLLRQNQQKLSNQAVAAVKPGGTNAPTLNWGAHGHTVASLSATTPYNMSHIVNSVPSMESLPHTRADPGEESHSSLDVFEEKVAERITDRAVEQFFATVLPHACHAESNDLAASGQRSCLLTCDRFLANSPA